MFVKNNGHILLSTVLGNLKTPAIAVGFNVKLTKLTKIFCKSENFGQGWEMYWSFYSNDSDEFS